MRERVTLSRVCGMGRQALCPVYHDPGLLFAICNRSHPPLRPPRTLPAPLAQPDHEATCRVLFALLKAPLPTPSCDAPDNTTISATVLPSPSPLSLSHSISLSRSLSICAFIGKFRLIHQFKSCFAVFRHRAPINTLHMIKGRALPLIIMGTSGTRVSCFYYTR